MKLKFPPAYFRLLAGSALMILLLAGLAGIWNIDQFTSPAPEKRLQPASTLPGPDTYPSDWAWMRRTYPYWKADVQAFRESMRYAREMRRQAERNPLEQLTFAGPTNIGGRISDIEFNPLDANIVYAGAATGGVFKSTDMGQTWFPIFDDAGNLSIGDIGIDPVNPDVIYVGTGEANGGHNNFAGGGVYKSSDAGTTWQFLGLENTVSIGRIVIDPSNTQRVFVAAQGSYFGPNPDRGVYLSEDGGQSWTQVLFISDSTAAADLVIDPVNPNNMMAAMWERARYPEFGTHLYGPTSGIYRSTDGGVTWSLLGPTTGLPNATVRNVGRIGLGISPSSPNIVYALYNDGSNLIGFYRTSDFGNTWVNMDTDFEMSNGTAGFSWYFGQVRVHPADPNTVYALDVAFMRSQDGGLNWPIMYGYGGPGILHVDHHALAFSPSDPNFLIEGNDGGINISGDGGVNWTKVAELPINQFYEIGLDAQNPERLYGGTQDNGTLRTLTAAVNSWDRILGGDGFYVIVDHSNPNIIYAESQFGNLYKSTTGGGGFFPITNGISGPTNWSTPVVMDPIDPNKLYYGSNRVYRTGNGGNSWSPFSPDLTTAPPGSRLGTITTIGVSPVNTNIIWAGTDDSNVWATADDGASWNNVSASLPNRWVTRVIPDPFDANSAYVTFNGLKWREPQPHVFRTTDLGQTWQDVSSNLPDAPVNALAADPNRPGYLYLGSDLGAYYSRDYGGTWQYLSPDLPLVSVYDLKVHPTANYLAVGTHGRSIYKMDLASLVGIGDLPPQLSGVFRLYRNYPNPFNPATTIPYRLAGASPVELSVFDALGRKIAVLVDAHQSPGLHQASWDGRNAQGVPAASGTYFYRLKVDGKVAVRKMLLMR